MIVPMRKYLFLVHHADYTGFLEGLRELGVLHVREQEGEPSEDLMDRLALQQRLKTVKKGLEKRHVDTQRKATASPEEGHTVIAKYESLMDKLEPLLQKRATVRKEFAILKPWGDFSIDTVKKLEATGLEVQFFVCAAKRYDPNWEKEYPITHLRNIGADAYFVGITKAEEPIELPEVEMLPDPQNGTVELKEKKAAFERQISEIEAQLDRLAEQGLPAVNAALRDLQDTTQLMTVIERTRREADKRLMVLEGYAPKGAEQDLEALCDRAAVPYMKEQPKPKDQPPVLLRNSRFSRLFEPIAELFALPSYGEMDLTPYFAPFFMLFFGFCLGDAGYGIVLLIGATVYKFWADKSLRSTLTLVQLLGVATILFGALTGTIFGLNLLQDQFAWLGEVRAYMLNSDQAFELALLLGLVQILLGLGVKAFNKGQQYGWLYGIAPVGWILLILGLADIGVAEFFLPYSKYIAWAGVGLILLFSDPKAGVLGRIGSGVWAMYGVTGIFGDLLSYVRLFALGIASAILGMVVNDIALQIRDSIDILGPILFVVFLLVGHTGNLLVASLGAFVHPLRLTFVEFYKNAGFEGGGKPYDPLRQQNNI
jgi:V/A-type H+/Na+-transporting ATPase subunit I